MNHILPVRTYLIIFGVLMVLLFATVGAAFINMGPFNFPVAMAIAAVKAVLIVLYFMHLKFGQKLVWVFASASFVWLGILIAMTMNDYLTRGWLGIPGK